MYVYSMTHEEILKEYLKDYPYVERKSGYDISKFRSDFYHKSRQTYPYSKVYEYKVPASLNRYLYVLVAMGFCQKTKAAMGPF